MFADSPINLDEKNDALKPIMLYILNYLFI